MPFLCARASAALRVRRIAERILARGADFLALRLVRRIAERILARGQHLPTVDLVRGIPQRVLTRRSHVLAVDLIRGVSERILARGSDLRVSPLILPPTGERIDDVLDQVTQSHLVYLSAAVIRHAPTTP